MIPDDKPLPVRTRRLGRIMYAVALLICTLMLAFSGKEQHLRDLADNIYAALDAINPFVLTARWADGEFWNRGTLDEMSRGGLLSAAILIVSALALFLALNALTVLKDVSSVTKVFAAIALSGFLAFPLKWLLIGLTLLFGQAMGVLAWINGLAIGLIEGVLHLKHVYEGGVEVKHAIQQTAQSYKGEH